MTHRFTRRWESEGFSNENSHRGRKIEGNPYCPHLPGQLLHVPHPYHERFELPCYAALKHKYEETRRANGDRYMCDCHGVLDDGKEYREHPMKREGVRESNLKAIGVLNVKTGASPALCSFQNGSRSAICEASRRNIESYLFGSTGEKWRQPALGYPYDGRGRLTYDGHVLLKTPMSAYGVAPPSVDGERLDASHFGDHCVPALITRLRNGGKAIAAAQLKLTTMPAVDDAVDHCTYHMSVGFEAMRIAWKRSEFEHVSLSFLFSNSFAHRSRQQRGLLHFSILGITLQDYIMELYHGMIVQDIFKNILRTKK